MDHARAEIGPPERLMLLGLQMLAPLGAELAAGRGFEGVEVERGLGREAAVEEGADLEIAVDRGLDPGLVAALGERFDHQRVELGVLRLLHPVMLEKALEQRVEPAVVADRIDIMALGHPLDLQDDERDRERVVAKNLGGDRLGRADRLAGRSEGLGEALVEKLEEVDVLRFLAGEVEQGADPMVVAVQLRTGMVEHEGEDELLHQAEYGEIFVAANLVEDALLVVAQKGDRIGAREGFRKEAPAEVELGMRGKDVLDLPGRFDRAGEDVTEVES